jgi:mannan endo-1,4-beta-mannosidase
VSASSTHGAARGRRRQQRRPIRRSAHAIDPRAARATLDAVRPLALNLLSGGATLLILAVLALPAKSVLDDGVEAEHRAPAAPLRPALHPRRVFGAYVDPWHVDDWARDIGAAPQAVAKFEAFSRRRTLDKYAAESRRQGIRRMMVSWEPWTPVPSALGVAAQSAPQPGYRNIDVARGAQDRYITAFARSLARYPGAVYLRYAHEMNGYWYPWSHDPKAYRWAWRRMVRLFALAGARNVRFVWAVNANLYEPAGVWRRTLRRYWPGDRYVDLVGSTMIDFGGSKDYPVRAFAGRLRALRRSYRKPIVLAETNTDYRGRVRWLGDLRAMLRGMPWIRAIMWSQLPSRGKVQQRGTGNVDWDIRRDPAAASELRRIIEDGLR